MNMMEETRWIFNDFDSIGITLVTTLGIYLTVITITRINGLRTFAKMSSFDFAITIAIGSLMASTILSPQNSLVKGIVALVFLIMLQAVVARLRKRSDSFDLMVTNSPVLLMKGKTILWSNLKAQRVTEADLYAKLRKANITDMNQILAVVLETTGDISVLHADDGQKKLDTTVLKHVNLPDK